MSSRRDRHARGVRGPLALPSPLTRRTPRPPQRADRAAFFLDAVPRRADELARHAAGELAGVAFGVDAVLGLGRGRAGGAGPLAAHRDAVPRRPPEAVVDRRPL